MEPIRLTRTEWEIVEERYCQCAHWDDLQGCTYPGIPDNLPVGDCRTFYNMEDFQRGVQDGPRKATPKRGGLTWKKSP